jgi:hypothetical protein
MNTEQVAIGRAAYGRQGRAGFFDIESNKENIYRVLPPIKSLAPKSKYAQFYATHRGFRGTDGKQRPFRCVEEFNFKTKVITAHCPVCDKVAELEAQLKAWADSGAPKDQVKKFRDENIFPFQAERKYYLNVVNPENRIGILPIGSKMFKALDDLCKKQEALGRDICGLEGVYLTFQKKSAYKGDAQAIFNVELYMHRQPDGRYAEVIHHIDQAFAQRLGPEAADLGMLFNRILTVEQIAQIIALEGNARAQYMDQLFAEENKPAQVYQPPQGYVPPIGSAPAPAATMAPPPTAFAAPPPVGFSAPTSAPLGTQQPLAPAVPPAFQSGFGAPTPTPAATAPAPAPTALVAPPAAFQPPAGFTPPVGFGSTAEPAPQAPTPPPAGFGAPPPAGFGQTAAPAAQMDDQEFINMVRPKKEG